MISFQHFIDKKYDAIFQITTSTPKKRLNLLKHYAIDFVSMFALLLKRHKNLSILNKICSNSKNSKYKQKNCSSIEIFAMYDTIIEHIWLN